jgi:dephospho-CoA kinase
MLRMGESRIVIGVAGRIGSGKSVAAHHLEHHCGFQYLRYSLVLADWFKTDPTVKPRLQEVGWEVMSGVGQRELNRRLISKISSDQNCAVDGLRHPIDYESLKNEFAYRFFLIYIDTPSEIRFERLRNRFRSYSDFLAADRHPVESSIDLLIPCASFVLSGIQPLKEFGEQLEGLVSQFRAVAESPGTADSPY